MSWKIGKQVVTAKNDETVPADVLVSVEGGNEIGINSYITKINVTAANSANANALPTASGAEQGNAYGSFSLEKNLDNPAELYVAGTNPDKDVPNVTTGEYGDVFTLNFLIPNAKDITFNEVETADNGHMGERYALYNVSWVEMPELINTGDTSEEEFQVVPKEYKNGYIKVYAPDEYVYQLNGKDIFCFAHDPRTFDEILANADLKIFRRNTRTNELEDITADVAGSLKLTIADGGYETPLEAYMTLGENACYYKGALKATFTDGTTEIVLGPDNGFTASAFIGVKGDANLDGVCNAKDGAAVLKFAAAQGAGRVDGKAYDDANRYHLSELTGDEELLAFFLADINAENENFGLAAAGNDAKNPFVDAKNPSRAINPEDPEAPVARVSALDASDARDILRFAAKVGKNGPAYKDGVVNESHKSMPTLWNEVYGVESGVFDSLPPYSKEIAEYMLANPDKVKENQAKLDNKIYPPTA
jgi:hypothetical protein